ncbi:MAG: hypothetical protein ACN6O3_12180 [Comamonas sp.]
MTVSAQQALAPLLQAVSTQPQWALPEFVDLGRPAWGDAMRGLAWAMAVVIALSFWQAASGREALAALAVVALAWLGLHRWRRRRSAPLGEGLVDGGRGCVADVAQRRIRSTGMEPSVQWLLEPAAEWSLGRVAFQDRPRQRHGWRVELRHARKGPVAVLCTVLHMGRAEADLLALDALVDEMAQRLDLRQSGDRCVPRAADGGRRLMNA